MPNDAKLGLVVGVGLVIVVAVLFFRKDAGLVSPAGASQATPTPAIEAPPTPAPPVGLTPVMHHADKPVSGRLIPVVGVAATAGKLQ